MKNSRLLLHKLPIDHNFTRAKLGEIDFGMKARGLLDDLLKPYKVELSDVVLEGFFLFGKVLIYLC